MNDTDREFWLLIRDEQFMQDAEFARGFDHYRDFEDERAEQLRTGRAAKKYLRRRVRRQALKHFALDLFTILLVISGVYVFARMVVGG